jgi:ribosomal protein L22
MVMFYNWFNNRSNNNMSIDKEINYSFKKVRLIERLVTYHDLKSDMDKLINQIEKELVLLDKENAEKGDHNVVKGTKA